MRKRTKSRANKIKWWQLSKSIRADVGKCEYCGLTDNLQTHHIVSKYYKKSLLRFERSNLIVVCPKCHFDFHKNPVSTMEWFRTNRPDDYKIILDKLNGL